MNPIKLKIEEIIGNIIYEIYKTTNFDKLTTPPKKDMGEYCIGFFLLSKELKKSPLEIAKEVQIIIEQKYSDIKTNITGPYLNLNLSFDFYTKIFLENTDIKTQLIGQGKTVVVDYIGANIGKPLHIGHMCTPNQGQVTCNLYRYLGYNVIGDSHLGDWGIIFGKLICSYKKWGDEEKLKENAVDYLLELYIKITQEIEKNQLLEEEIRNEFKKLSSGDENNILLWQKFTRYSIDAMQIQLDRINIKPTYDIGESFYEGLKLPKMGDFPDLIYNMSDIVKDLIQKNIAIQNEDNSVGVIFDENTKIPSCMLAKRDGTHGYLASDITSIKYRKNVFNPIKIIYHVDSRQSLHLKQVFEISKMAGYADNIELFHASNGFISLKSGAMSSRKGNIIKLNELLDEAVLRAKNILLAKNPDLTTKERQEISEIIGIGSIKYGYLSKSRNTDVIFDWDEFLSFEGNSFPYVAYSYVRAKKLIEKSSFDIDFILSYENKTKFNLSEQNFLFKEILEINEVILDFHDNILSHNLVIYIYNLSKIFSSFYNNININSIEDEDYKILNLKLIMMYIKNLEIIFDILAIKLPNKM